MGTKSNINFLGTGDKGMKGTTFSGQLNDDFLNLGFGKDDMIRIIEQDAGYVTAGKLNDAQLNTMFNNLKMIDETFSPPPGPLNVIDLKTRTRDLNKEGLMSLRQSDDVGGEFVENTTGSVMVPDKRGPGFAGMEYKIKEGIETLKTKSPFRGSGKAADEIQDIVDQKFGKGYFDDVAGDIERVEKKAAEENFIKAGAADFSDFVSAEGGRRAVVRQVMKNNANYFGLPPEMAESIAKSKDLGKGGSNFPDPLLVFRNVGNFTTDELTKIDEIIEANPFDDVKNIADKVSDYLQSIRPDGFTSAFAEGGRIGYRSGKTVKGIAELLKLGNKKFGKGTLKTADEIEPSEFAKFNERNKVLDDLDIEDYTDELGDPETWYTFGMTVREADELVKSRKAYEAQMFTDYKAGRLDPKPGESGRKRFLEKKAEDAEMSGDSRLFTPDEADELTMLEASSPANVESALGAKQYGGIKNAEVPMELMTVDIIKVKYPQIPDEMAEMIASLPNDKKALAIADLEQAIMLQGSGRSSDEIIEIMKREPKTKMKKGGLAQILEM